MRPVPILWISIIMVSYVLAAGAADFPSLREPGAGTHQTIPDNGVVYYIPGANVPDDTVIQQLHQIREQGFRHVNLSSWVWTLPHSGTPLRRRVDLILNWCDQNDLGVWLLHNVQYGTGEYGDFEQAIKDPVSYVKPVVVDWIDALKGHRCVRGVQLGNEVGPAIPQDAAKVPLYVKAFAEWLQHRYHTVTKLNATWGASFAAFDAVGLPAADSPGRIDLQQFANLQFGQFYGTIFDILFKPALGAKLGYTSKTGPDPYLYAAYPGATVLGWDDMVANHPLWTLRVLTDCDPRPAFNSEMHLYHDSYAYFPSAELSRYRYLMDPLSGEWMTSSFAWGSWNKPEIAAIHKATSRDLAEVSRLAPILQLFDQARRSARIGVLVTYPLLELSSRNLAERPVMTTGASPVTTREEHTSVPLEDAHAALSATGRHWRFVLDLNLTSQGRKLDVLIVPGNRRIPAKTVQKIAALPNRVRVVWAGEWPTETEYRQPLPPDLLRKLRRRCRRAPDLDIAAGELTDPLLPGLYRQITIVPYSWWSPKRGSYGFGVRYPRVEARRAGPGGSLLVALINNTRESITIPGPSSLPWVTPHLQILDLTARLPVNLAADTIVLAPFDIRLYRYERTFE